MALFTSLILLALTLYTTASTLVSNNASLLWGPYRPNHYLGIRPRVPESLLMGLMWGKLDEGEKSLRHTIEKDDNMAGYGWTSYDSRIGGSQTIHDVENEIDLTTEFVKKHEGQEAGNWALRVRGTPRNGAEKGLKLQIVFYVGMEKMQGCAGCNLDATAEEKGTGDDKEIEEADIMVKHSGLGRAGIRVTKVKGQRRTKRAPVTGKHESMSVKSVNVTEDELWQSKCKHKLFLEGGDTPSCLFHAKATYIKTLKDGTKLFGKPNALLSNEPGIGNMHFVQMVFQDSFEFDILYSSKAATVAMTSQELTSSVRAALDSFQSMFSATFLPSPPFNTTSHVTFSQSLLSNLFGGLSYFHGSSLISEWFPSETANSGPNFWEDAAKSRQHRLPQRAGPFDLLTHVPSRSVFPRGFLWDEGFHLHIVVDWDLDLALEVVRSWLSLISDEGWIAQEQILGLESRVKVPKNFVVQYPDIANPPTLFWIVERYMHMLSGKVNYNGRESVYLTGKDESEKLLKELYPLLKRHYEWFRKTQSGDLLPRSLVHDYPLEAYRWRGRTPGSNCASGLDDYPRAEPPHITELHVDALCWVGVMAGTLVMMAGHMNNGDDATTLQRQYKIVKDSVIGVHWSKKEETYCDAVISEGQHTHVCHKGYLSIFPLLTGFMGPEHPHLDAVLSLLRDPKELWSDYGIRSLSKKDALYGSGDDHWRSPIWINMNFLIIEQLLALAQMPGPHQKRCKEIYIDLRDNVIRTTYSSWKETGFAWEQYNDKTGAGQRTHGFTGWTALVVKIMAFPDLKIVGDFGESSKDKVEDLLKEMGADSGFGIGTLMMVIMLCWFVYVTRRRFAALFRAMGRL